ncbi:MAG TPA: aminotransferase class IV [Candidatus Binatia bacterium]|jgi:branched-chain amino acid aminotransferase
MKVSTPQFVHLNGRLLAASRAQISVFDRGLLYGDGLFETLRAYKGSPFGLDEHLSRLQASASFLGIGLPRQPWQKDIVALLRRNKLLDTDAWVRITVTRGVAAPTLLPPSRLHPTLIISAGPLHPTIAKAQRRGARVALLPFARHGVLVEHKVLNYLPAVLGKVIAARHGAFEGLFVNADGLVTEGTTSNIFVWRHTQLLTPPPGGVLPGLTRRLIMEAAVADGLRVTERPLTTHDLLDADEAFITSSLVEVVPIIAVDTRSIGNGQVGARTQRLQRLYRQMVDHALARR